MAGAATSNWTNARRTLDAGVETLGLSLGRAVRAGLIHYLETLAAWNTTYNLTAVRNPEAMVVRHVLDCLTVLPVLRGRTLADIGSGAGLPGLVVAITRPKIDVTLIESNRKKAAFLRHAKRELGLANVRIVQQRVEDWQPVARFEVVTARAFASVGDCIDSAGHILAGDGEFVLMKGHCPIDELAALPPAWRLIESRSVSVPELDAARHLVRLERGLI